VRRKKPAAEKRTTIKIDDAQNLGDDAAAIALPAMTDQAKRPKFGREQPAFEPLER
jgi:hypothetical protein